MRSARLGSVGRLAVAAALLALAIPAVAPAEVIDEEEVSHFSMGFLFGYSGTRMTAFNENIDVVNFFLAHQGEPIRAADRLTGSMSGRVELRYKFGQKVSVALGVGNTEAKSAFNVTWAQSNFYTRGVVWSGMVYYHLPFVQSAPMFTSLADRMSLYVGAGPVLLTQVSTHVLIVDRTVEQSFMVDGDLGEIDGVADATGSNGLGVQGLVGASWQLTRRFSVAAEAGYRFVKSKDLTVTHMEGLRHREVETDKKARPDPMDQAMYDFFHRELGSRERRDWPGVFIPEKDEISGEHILYYSDYGTPLDLDFSGFQAQIGLRIHMF